MSGAEPREPRKLFESAVLGQSHCVTDTPSFAVGARDWNVHAKETRREAREAERYWENTTPSGFP